MSVYFVTVGNNHYQVEIQNNLFKVDGLPFEMGLKKLNENGLYLIEQGRQKLEMLLKTQDRNKVAVMVNQRHMVVQVEKRNGKKTRVNDREVVGQVKAPMPGMVMQVLVVEGQVVSEGQVLLVLESMKMQMEMRSPMAGTVQKVAVQPGQRTEKGLLLVMLAE